MKGKLSHKMLINFRKLKLPPPVKKMIFNPNYIPNL